MIKISNRLKTIADFIKPEDYILDVGCDHALLPIYILLNKKNVKAIASDINKKPLERAKANKKLYKVKSLKIVQADGLKALTNEVNTIILSGLGTTTILNILFKNKTKLDNINKIIISSNNDLYKLRKKMMHKKYKIFQEEIVYEKGKYYIIIGFEKGIKKYNIYELKYGPLLLKKPTKIYKDYIKKIINKNEKIIEKMPNKYFIKKIILKKETMSLKRI